jgi:hypothetical protein
LISIDNPTGAASKQYEAAETIFIDENIKYFQRLSTMFVRLLFTV